jgi:MFS family permease
MSEGSSQQGIKLGFLELAPGVSRSNAFVFFYAAFSTIGLLTFVSTGTAQVLNAIGVPGNEQGTITADLVVVTEIVQILIFGLVGVLADRIGRREVATVGMILMGIAYALYPYAESVSELMIYRGIYAFGLGASAGMVGTLIADYPADSSRGKFVAVGGAFNGIGVVVVTVVFGANAAPMLVAAGYDPLTATRIAHGVVAAACFISAIVFYLGLKKGTPGEPEDRPSTKELMTSGITEALKNPRIALAYACGFVARGDQVILGTFTVLWGTRVGIDSGMDYATASGKGALIFAIAGTASLIWLPVLGIAMDRMNRVSAIILCMGCAAVGYSATYFVDEATMFTSSGFPLSLQATFFFFLLGIGQISAFLGATVLISQEAPKLKRGAVVGMFNTFGAIGIFIAVSFGGRLFDVYGGYAPFVLIGAMNVVVVLFAIIVRIKAPGDTESGKPLVSSSAG